MKYVIRTGVLASAFSVLLAANAFAQANWDMPTPYGDGIFHTKNIHQFAEDVKAGTNGNLTITVHSANSLFSHAEIKDAVRDGLVPIGEFFLSRLANEDPIYELDTIPFLATSYEDAEALWEVSRQAISEKLAQDGLTLLYAVPWPGASLYLRREATEPAHLQGLNFRAYNAVQERLATLLGSTPTQVEETDIPTAFSTGRVDAMMTSPSTGANHKAWDFTTHYIDVKAALTKNIIVVNTDIFEALDEADRNAVIEAAAAAEARGWQLSREEDQEKIAELAAGGLIVSQPTEALAAKLHEVGAILTSEWEAKAGEDARAVLEAYRDR